MRVRLDPSLLNERGTTEEMGSKISNRRFPEGFRWGAATAGHQIEGNNVNSDLWFLENMQPTIFVDRSGDSCDSYHRYKEDIALLVELGLDTYRFSVEWSRLEPSSGHFSIAELDHYKRVMDCCHSHNVSPAVTFFHAAAPRWFAELGGWTAADASERFARYCSFVARGLADGMEFAFTINEPQVGKVFRCIPGAGEYFASQDPRSVDVHEAAAENLGVEGFRTMDYPDIDSMTPQLILGHEKGYAAIKAARSDLQVGVTLSLTDFQPAASGSPYEDIRSEAYGLWLDAIVRTGDFTGVQTYRQVRIPGSGDEFPVPPALPFVDPTDLIAAMQRPEALRNTVEYVYDKTRKPILVTENGLETDDDERRAWYIDAALSELLGAIESGIPVLGYFHWSLIDNFEWTRGYAPKFGLASVDHTTFARALKPSAAHLSAIARANAVSA
jgi:beta-glucosidase